MRCAEELQNRNREQTLHLAVSDGGVLWEPHELHGQNAPPEAEAATMAGVDCLNTAWHIRRVYSKIGLVWRRI